jgi:3-hydroxyacyl-CoA dehydrogenase/enoyl-CoA hydratase/3-hydroxybutyryl-CoA epimerase
MANQEYQNWKLQVDDQKILWLAIDRHNSSVNSLNREVLLELDQILSDIDQNDSIGSVIIYSLKKTGFIAGADITQFTEISSEDEAFNLIRQGQLIFNKLSLLKKPTVAMIDGFCLGGGLELALACRYRVADDSRHTRLGLPEVLLGIHPGWGGTVRLPLLIGAPKAMDLILSGRLISAKAAKKLGVVDEAVPNRVLKSSAIFYALNHPAPHKAGFLESATNASFVRPILANVFLSKLKQKIKPEHYPAPFAVIQNWQNLGPQAPTAQLEEAKSIAKMMVSPTGRNLVRVFFLREEMKALAKGLKFKPKHVHVIGAGTMGSAIAAWCAINGLTVTLQDQNSKFVASGLKKAHDIIKKKVKSPTETMLTMDRVDPDINGKGIAKADVIIEAIIENLEAKHELYKALEPQIKEGALLATNTSSLPLAELSKGLKHPEDLVGIHFFNPVEKMELVEVVSDDLTASSKVNDAIAFIKRINRLPLPVKSEPGFLVNRILMPYLMESVVLLEEGIPAEVIDKAAKDFGMPMGPIELADRVGLDVCLSVADILTRHLGGEVPNRLREMVANNKLGVKTGEGFYRYQNNKPIRNTDRKPVSLSQEEIIDRLILRMLNESVACLREGIVDNGELLDAGMIFGTGFAPFRGGPIHYAQTRGINEITQRLEQFARQYGQRFQPDEGWKVLQEKESTTAVKKTEVKENHETSGE